MYDAVTATRCTLQHVAHCNTLHTATRCTLQHTAPRPRDLFTGTQLCCNGLNHPATQYTARHYKALQQTATHCNRLATHCNTLQHTLQFTATHWNTLQHTVTRLRLYCSVLQCAAVCCSVLQCVAACCSVLQCVAACCSVLWHTSGVALRDFTTPLSTWEHVWCCDCNTLHTATRCTLQHVAHCNILQQAHTCTHMYICWAMWECRYICTRMYTRHVWDGYD